MSNRKEAGSSAEGSPPRVQKFTPEGVEVPMDREETEAALRAFAKQREWQDAETRRRAIYGECREIITGIHVGRRYVAFGDTVSWVPANYIPMQYFSAYALSQLGDSWETRIRRPVAGDEHPLVCWAESANQHHRNARPDEHGVLSYMPNDAMVALFRLGYEGFIVQNNATFRDEVFRRLQAPSEFHGARNELSVGAFLVVAGFDVEFLPEEVGKKTPDLSAVHTQAGVTFAVEAKRRHREKSVKRESAKKQGVWKLGLRRRLKSAIEQLLTRPRPWILALDPELEHPLPDESDVAFREAVLRDLRGVCSRFVPPLEPPELLLLLQLPYHNSDLFAVTRYSEVRLLPSACFSCSSEWRVLEPILRKANWQFSRVPFTWADVHTEPESRFG